MILAMVIVIPFCLALTLFTFRLTYDVTWFCQTKTDGKSLRLFWIAISFLLTIMVAAYYIPDMRTNLIVMLSLCVPFISLFIIYDTQLLLGRRSNEFVYRVIASLQAEFSISFWFFVLYVVTIFIINITRTFETFETFIYGNVTKLV